MRIQFFETKGPAHTEGTEDEGTEDTEEENGEKRSFPRNARTAEELSHAEGTEYCIRVSSVPSVPSA
jgi:hypothetical protein